MPDRTISQTATTLVIPGRNVAATIRPCLDAVCPLLETSELVEILFVDDGSTDASADILTEFPVRVLRGGGQGAAAARNLGWREASTPLIWFIDADCVAEPDALRRLLPHMEEPSVAGVGGSYGNMRPESLQACLIHEEILARHRRMPAQVNVLASFNVLYRRAVLEKLDGFDTDCFWAHDAELAYRVGKRGFQLIFDPTSRVGHFHPNQLASYLFKQGKQGYYRVLLYQRHPARMAGDSYSGWLDYVQPPLALLLIASLWTMFWPGLRWIPIVILAALLVLQLPMTIRMIHSQSLTYAMFAPLGFVRAFFRGFGLSMGIASVTSTWVVSNFRPRDAERKSSASATPP